MTWMSDLHQAIPRWLLTIIAIALLVIAAPFLLSVVVAYAAWTCFLYLAVWAWWIGRAPRRVLFVYSESPNWKEHIEQQILPRLPHNAVVLNWSRRKQWPRFSLAVLLFRAFAGDQEFNPIALVFTRFGFVERFRFWQPFRDAKHGKDEPLKMLQAALFERLEI
jgi:hypothetical protein